VSPTFSSSIDASQLGMVADACNPMLGSLRWEDCKFEASLGYMVGACLKQINKQTNKPINGLGSTLIWYGFYLKLSCYS
jgi:hypothetical protein